MRPTCTDCALKHLAQASILEQESRQGYPTHIHYALGHMAEAEAELIQQYPKHAEMIRKERKRLEAFPGAKVNFDALIKTVDKECDVCDLAEKGIKIGQTPNPGRLYEPYGLTLQEKKDKARIRGHCTLKSNNRYCRLTRCIKKKEHDKNINAVAVCRASIYPQQ